MKKINYKGKGEHCINELEKIIEQREEELHLIKSGQVVLNLPIVVNCTTCKFTDAKYSEVKCNRCSGDYDLHQPR